MDGPDPTLPVSVPHTQLRGSGSTCRINKFFTQQGLCSRREADRLVEQGRVTVNGRVAVLGDVVGREDVIARDGVVVPWGNQAVYIKYHKPLGITSTTEGEVLGNIIAAVGHPDRIFPIGRLDKDSTGLILLTNDGEIVNAILRSEHGHEKEYIVRVDRAYDQEFLDRMSTGVVILGRSTRSCLVTRIGKAQFRIVLTEGRNRQIRRMSQALGYRVVALQRIRVMHLHLGDLPVGQWRNLTAEERRGLFRALGLPDGDRRFSTGRSSA